MTQASSIGQTTGNNLVFQDSIEVNAPVGEVYRRWTDFQTFPRFMSHVEQVTPLGDNRYHWVARVLGVKQEWDAQVTEMMPNRQVSWRSISGTPNAGTVTFEPTASGGTIIRLRLEYAPPAGKVGETLLQLTNVTKREVHENLEHFKRQIQGGPTTGGISSAVATAASQATQTAQLTAKQIQQLQQEYVPGIGGVIQSLAIPLATSVAGGVAAYWIGRNIRKTTAFKAYTSPVALPNAIAGWALTGATGASILGAATLRSRGNLRQALFVGQWAPTLLGGATLAGLLGDRRLQTTLPASVTSWSYVAAALGAVGWSALLHVRGKQQQSLFVGQWAHTLLGAANFTRLFRGLISR